jgi:putative ABC transport system permease protein
VGSFGGIILTLLGALLAAPLVAALGAGLVRPLTRRLPGVGVRLAADNLLRAPSRTGVVVGALTAGVALSVQVAGVLESNERPIIEWVDRAIMTDLIVTGGENTAAATSSNLPLDTALGDELRRLPGVRQAVSGRYRRPTYGGTIIFLLAFDAARFHDANRVYPDYPGLDLFRRLAEPGTVIVSDNFAVMHNVRPGDVLTLQGTRGPAELRVIGAVPDYSWTRGTVFIDRSTLWDVFEDDRVDIYEVYLKGGERTAAEAAVRAVAARRALTVVTRDDLRGYISGALHRLFGLVQVQQFIVGTVASLGVVTALLISVLQRRRELGLLRSVGATRAQVLRSVLAEAALLGLFGTLFGLGVGLVFEWYVIRVLVWEEGGFVLPILIPWAAAATVAGVSLGLAVLAGLGPALHAARLQIAEVVAYE